MNATVSRYTLGFDSTEPMLTTIGGKGMNLNHLTRAGFPVPPGFFLTTAAYQTFVDAHHLQAQILALVNDKTKPLEETSAAIRLLFDGGDIPPDVVRSIQENYHELTTALGISVPLAVRSSATAEDLPGASFAGQHESYLNVHGEEALLEAVKRCWSSLWTARAIEYRARQAIAPTSVRLAVVVQVMIPAEASGIMFTANPITGTRDEVALEAAWGLGESIVGGLVTPDHIIADKATGVIKQVTIGEKSVMTVPTVTSTEERDVDAERRNAPVLNVAHVAELVRLGVAIEAHYGEPQDIEWCFANHQFYIVQARPITALAPEAVRWESPVPGAIWMKDVQAAEWVTEPLSPLGATTTLGTMISARQQARIWPPVPKVYAPWSALINGWLYIRVNHKPASLVASILGLGLNMLMVPPNGNRRVAETWGKRLDTLHSLEQVTYGGLSGEALRTHVDHLLNELAWWWWEFTWIGAVGRTSSQVLTQMGVPNVPALFRGNDSLLLEAEYALRKAAHDPREIEAYLARFGHTVESADPIHATLRESAEHLAWQLAASRQSEHDPKERLAQIRSVREQATASVRAMKGMRGYLARKILAVGQSHAAHTDNAVFHFQRVLAALRAAFLEAGGRLVRAGTLERTEDVFYLERAELWSAMSGTTDRLATKIAERRAVREQHKRLAPPLFIPPISDLVWTNDPLFKRLPPAMRAAMFESGVREQNGKQVLVGSSGSPGRARGIARVILNPADFGRFQKGDVLVTRATSPIWTPLLSIASAAVTEVGGQFSHAAIVAREFGIPLVDGAPNATRLIADGTPVIVDGSSGVVEFGVE